MTCGLFREVDRFLQIVGVYLNTANKKLVKYHFDNIQTKLISKLTQHTILIQEISSTVVPSILA